VIFSSILFIQQ